MKVQGEHSLPLSQQAAWDLLLDTDVLSRAMPGCESLVPIGPDEYEMKMSVAVSSMKGLFAGKIRITDKNPPSSYRLQIQGQGKLGHVSGDGVLTFLPDGEATKISFAGDVRPFARTTIEGLYSYYNVEQRGFPGWFTYGRANATAPFVRLPADAPDPADGFGQESAGASATSRCLAIGPTCCTETAKRS